MSKRSIGCSLCRWLSLFLSRHLVCDVIGLNFLFAVESTKNQFIYHILISHVITLALFFLLFFALPHSNAVSAVGICHSSNASCYSHFRFISCGCDRCHCRCHCRCYCYFYCSWYFAFFKTYLENIVVDIFILLRRQCAQRAAFIFGR